MLSTRRLLVLTALPSNVLGSHGRLVVPLRCGPDSGTAATDYIRSRAVLVALKANFKRLLLALWCRDDAGYRVPLALGDLDSPTGRSSLMCCFRKADEPIELPDG